MSQEHEVTIVVVCWWVGGSNISRNSLSNLSLNETSPSLLLTRTMVLLRERNNPFFVCFLVTSLWCSDWKENKLMFFILYSAYILTERNGKENNI
jgi:hypothetical protein